MKMTTIGASLAQNLASIPETKRELIDTKAEIASDFSPVLSPRK